ncbi:MAG: c-type cytochrome [Planctomycetales bacterium]|nr:c-type cytochrome [Planctomycetales bacterium]
MGHLRSVFVLIPAICFAWSMTPISTTCFGATETSAPDDHARPHWIWGTHTRQAGQQVTFVKSIPVRAAIQRATIHLAADFTRCQVSLNDTVLLELDEYGPWLEQDVTNDLRIGENRLSLRCRSGQGPAAVAISLQIIYADGTSATIRSGEDWTADGDRAVSFGAVAGELWNVDNLAKISAFDDYEQWRRASGAESGTDPATFQTTAGFEVDLVRSATSDEGSWVSMAVDPQGRVTIAREDKGLLRMSLSGNGSHVDKVETINDDLMECRGLLYAYDSLYANANNSKGMYRLRDTDGDDRFDDVKLLREFPGSVGHGRNDLALGPDGMIYSIHGDSVELAKENITDRTSPLRPARNGIPSEEGHVIRTDRDGTRWELVASGLRNPFGIDFNRDGQAFTYDADNEYDMGAPWYRPTRIVQLVSGGDYGWRRKTNGEWPPYYPDHADNALPTVDVGKGSPTAMKSGSRSSFPEHYRRAMFALDWAYGRILACHLSPRGAGYACRVETFLAGRPLNVTDLDFGPDGNMYVITGGRKTQSALYRIRYVGKPDQPLETTPQQSQRETFSRRSRKLAGQLESLHRKVGRQAISTAWSHLADTDPMIRNAARIAIEHQPIELWRDAAMSEMSVELAATSLLALARAARPDDRPAILARLDAIDVGSMTALGKLSILHTYRLVLDHPSAVDSGINDNTQQRLIRWLENESDAPTAPLGSGYSVHQELARLVADHHVPGAVGPLIRILKSADSQRDRMNSLYMLCHQRDGWSNDDLELFFEALAELERTAFSGAGMPGRLQQIRERAVGHLNEQQRNDLADLIVPATLHQSLPKPVVRPFVQAWTRESLTSALDDSTDRGDSRRGEALFRDAMCASCHRIAGRGGVLGPDLTSLAARFSRSDILTSIVTPSDVIAEKYRGTQVITTDGKIISGQVVSGGDYRTSNLRIATDPLDPSKIVEIPKHEIEMHRPSEVSPMPEGLVNTLSAAEVADLLAYLTKGH